MAKDFIPWTSFTTPLGYFEWLVMPLGLKNVPSIFQKEMDRILNSFPFICVYIDDILVHSKNQKEHIKHLEIVLNKFIENALTISKKKMEINKQKIEFLGIILGEGKIQLQPNIVQTIL